MQFQQQALHVYHDPALVDQHEVLEKLNIEHIMDRKLTQSYIVVYLNIEFTYSYSWTHSTISEGAVELTYREGDAVQLVWPSMTIKKLWKLEFGEI